MRTRFFASLLPGALATTMATALTAGCGDPPRGRAPIVRIVLQPAFVPEGDGYQTVVSADGSTSADPFDDPDATRALLYHWTIDDEDDRARPLPTADTARVEFRVGAARPTTIHLEVIDGDGRSATGAAQLGLSIAN